MNFNRVTIIGVGLIGGSLALSLKKHGLCSQVWGWGRSAERLERALKDGVIDHATLDLSEAVKDADLVVLSTPVSSFEEIALKIKNSLKKGALITDVGSVKASVVKRLEDALCGIAYYVGSHPIAGSDRSGVEHARDDLFEGATVIITPTERTEPSALSTLQTLWSELGSKVLIVSAEEHDRMLSLISHLPHVIAYSLTNTVDAVNPEYLLYSGGGFKDTTRIALSSEELWTDICLFNQRELLKAIELFERELKKVKGALMDKDRERLIELFKRARLSRMRIKNG
ncbi:MAG: prephenate dehydrogenase [Nitrospirae bacterium]|nr:MAG: prephenate dehydrogenase [Nitrospirota bacterium]